MSTIAQPPRESQSLRRQIDKLATDIQHRASQTATLADLAADVLSDAAGEPTTVQMNNLHNLVDMALAHARQLGDLGEQVERLSRYVPEGIEA